MIFAHTPAEEALATVARGRPVVLACGPVEAYGAVGNVRVGNAITVVVVVVAVVAVVVVAVDVVEWVCEVVDVDG